MSDSKATPPAEPADDSAKAKTTVSSTSAPAAGGGIGMGVAALLIIGSLFWTMGFFAIWADRQILQTDYWTETSTQLLEDPVIRDQVATYMVDQLFQNVDVQAQLQAELPSSLKGLSGPATSGLRQLAL